MTKFRVFDKQEKKYVSNDNIVLKSDGLLYRVIVRGVIEFLELDPDRYVVEKHSTYCGHYEGDKFSVKLNSEETVTMTLVFRRDKFELACYRGEEYFTLETGYIDSPDVKHIGNIHGDKNEKD